MKFKKSENEPIRLPINALDEKQIGRLIKRLSEPCLDRYAIQAAYRLFDLDNPRIAEIDCREKHRHTSDCVTYHDLTAMVVDRLIQEIRRYRNFMSSVSNDLSHQG